MGSVIALGGFALFCLVVWVLLGSYRNPITGKREWWID